MLPDSDYRPAASPQVSVGFPVSLDVAPDLRRPPFIIAFWPCSMFWTGMPKAAIDKNGDPLAREGDIRTPPRQPRQRAIQAVAKAAAMKNSTQGHLRVGVPRSLPSHPPGCCVISEGALSSHKVEVSFRTNLDLHTRQH